MRGVKATLVAVVVALLAGAGRTAAQPQRVIPCHTWASYPNVLISSARNMSCRAAAREMRTYRGSISPTFVIPGRFHCYRVSGGRLSGQWRCVRGTRAFPFEFGD